MRTNIMKAQVYGFDFIGRWVLTDKLIFEGGYSHAGNQNADTHRQLPYTPGKAANGKVIYNIQLSKNLGMSLFTGARLTRGRSAWNWKPAQGSSADSPDGLIIALQDYEKWDAGISFTLYNNFRLYFNAYNILGKEIQSLDDAYTVYEGKRSYMGGVKMNFFKDF
jgi:outer membrane receptor for ferrienterochelin and colicin